jgi:hypothetical protein
VPLRQPTAFELSATRVNRGASVRRIAANPATGKPPEPIERLGPDNVVCHESLGGLLKYYQRKAAWWSSLVVGGR